VHARVFWLEGSGEGEGGALGGLDYSVLIGVGTDGWVRWVIDGYGCMYVYE
jgi:hypothetical protein